MWFKYTKKIKAPISIFLCSVLVAGSISLVPLTPKGEVLQAEAIFGVGDIVFDPQNAVFNTISSIATDFLSVKELELDPIANALAKMVLKSMTQSIVTWINNGFQGSPAFVSDLKQFMLERADQVAGDFIYNNPDLNFLCSPFQLDVKIALAVNYQQQAHGGLNAQCTLSDVTDNVEGFLNGNFNDGGWASWFEVTQNPVNTPTGAYLAAEAEMYARIVDEEGRQIRQLDWGNGFRPLKICDKVETPNGQQMNCHIGTPGVIIADQLSKSLGAGQDTLITADEIGEIVDALFGQLANQAITGAYGLLGLGGSQYSDNSYGASGNQSFLDALKEEKILPDSAANPFESAIDYGHQNITLQNKIISIVNEAESSLNSAKTQYGSCINLVMPQELITFREDAILKIVLENSTINTLTELNLLYLDSQNTDGGIQALTTYQEMWQDGLITTKVDIAVTTFFIDYEFATKIQTFKNSVSSARNRCENDQNP